MSREELDISLEAQLPEEDLKGAQPKAIFFNEFMTGFLGLMWPKLSAAATKLFAAKFSESLDAAVHSIPSLRGKVQYSIKFGSVAPQILAVYSYRSHSCLNDPEDIEVCGHLRWQGEVDMEFSIGPVRVGINRISLDGLGCVVGKPLLEQSPVIGGVQVFFCDPPQMELGLTGLGGFTSWTLVDTGIRKLVEEAFRMMMVLPNRFIVRFANTKVDDLPEYRSPPPQGLLRVRVLGADLDLEAGHQRDSHCIVRLGGCDGHTRMHQTQSEGEGLCLTADEASDSHDFLVHHERQLVEARICSTGGGVMKASAVLALVPPCYTVADLLHKQMESDEFLTLPLTSPGQASQKKRPMRVLRLYLEFFTFQALEPRALRRDLTLSLRKKPALLVVKIYNLSGVASKYAKGAQTRIRVGDTTVLSKKCKIVRPHEFYGFGERTAAAIVHLHSSGTTIECMADAFQLPVQAVSDVVRAQKFGHEWFGWNQTLYHLFYDPESATVAQLELCLQGRWFPVGEALDLSKLSCEPETPRRQDAGRAGGGQAWLVHGYTDGAGEASVGVHVGVSLATSGSLEPSSKATFLPTRVGTPHQSLVLAEEVRGPAGSGFATPMSRAEAKTMSLPSRASTEKEPGRSSPRSFLAGVQLALGHRLCGCGCFGL